MDERVRAKDGPRDEKEGEGACALVYRRGGTRFILFFFSFSLTLFRYMYISLGDGVGSVYFTLHTSHFTHLA